MNLKRRYFLIFLHVLRVSVVIFLVLVVILLVSPAFGEESLPIIEDEGDIYDLLLIEKISYEKYLDLLSLFRKGVDINTDEIMELIKIPGVSEVDLMRIKEFRDLIGPFKQIEDLKGIPGIDEEIYLRVLPFIRISSRKREEFKGRLRGQVKKTLDDDETPEFYNYLRLYYGEHTQGDISMKKEKGEDEFETTYRSFKLKNLGHIKEITLGDYKAYFGERLVIGHRFDGIMSRFKIGMFEPSLIYSYPIGEERVMGVHLDFSFPNKKAKIGGGYLAYRNGGQKVYGIHLNLPIKEMAIFSEWARVNDGGCGFIVGANLDLKPISFLASYRSYAQDFDNPYSDGFADSDGKDDDQDEEGVYLNVRYRVSSKWRATGSFNQWRHPSSLISDTKSGVKLSYDLSKKTEFKLFREWEDEDIDRIGGIKIKTGLESILQPWTKTKASLYVRWTEKDVTTSTDKQVDGYLRSKLRYKISDSLGLEAALKLRDTNIYKSGQFSTTYYLEWKDRLNDYLSFLSRYTNIYTSEHDLPNPKHEFKFQLEATW